jgi:hypothetical protein
MMRSWSITDHTPHQRSKVNGNVHRHSPRHHRHRAQRRAWHARAIDGTRSRSWSRTISPQSISRNTSRMRRIARARTHHRPSAWHSPKRNSMRCWRVKSARVASPANRSIRSKPKPTAMRLSLCARIVGASRGQEDPQGHEGPRAMGSGCA